MVGGRNYPYYDFTNESTDIRELFQRTCDRLGLHTTRPAPNRISLATRRDVALIDHMMTPVVHIEGDDPLKGRAVGE